MNSGNDNEVAGSGLNENPAIPDTTGIGNGLNNKNIIAPTITIGNFIVKGVAGGSQNGSVREELDKARRDTAQR